jgi:hypothetical protein
MEKIIIYGMGKHFETIMIQSTYLSNKMKKYEIVGFIDKNKHGEVFTFYGKEYMVMSLEEWTDFSVDKVVVTSKKYVDEIVKQVSEHGFRQEQICLLDEMVEPFINSLMRIDLMKGKAGLEVGGPSNVFSNIYKVCGSCDGVNFCAETVWWKNAENGKYMYEKRNLGKVYIADATDLSDIISETYDFVLSSNNLEHIANPMKALREFYRVAKKDGILIVVVPSKTVTFDHNRQFTAFEHLLEDYQKDTKEDDLTHLPEILEKHDYDMDPECGGRESFLQRAEKNYENRCLHHHVFCEESLIKLFEYFEIEVLETEELYGNYWIVGKK